jgi:hypothetical protein
MVGLWTVMLPLAPTTAAPVPFGNAAIVFETATATGELLTLAANVRLTTPTTPLAIVLVFMPETMQIIEPFPGLQEIVLPAESVAAPADTVTPVMLLVLYVRVHWRLLGAVEAFSERFRDAVPPGAADPDSNVSEVL